MSSTNSKAQSNARLFGASSEIININMIIDIDSLLRDFPDGGSADINAPTPINHNYSYMVASGAALNPTGIGTGDLAFGAAVGDVVRFTAVSEYNQFRQSVVLYDMFYIDGDHVFQQESFELRNGNEVLTPFPISFEEYNVSFIPTDFYWAQNTISSPGIENYGLRFALYVLERGQERPTFKGFFQWDPRVTVQG